MRIDSLRQEVKLLEIAGRGNKVGGENPPRETARTQKGNFSQELAKANEVNFSKHARERLYSRGIELSTGKIDQIAKAIDKAAVKGSKETLILDDTAAYVVAVPSRTVVTAFGKEHLREGVFTSIDSAIIL